MGQILHGSATATGVVRRAIQNSSDSLKAVSKRDRINPKMAPKWKKRTIASGPALGSVRPALDGARRRKRGGYRPRFVATERCRWKIAATRCSRTSHI
jgi:hypothetical protein